jgi:hypothetical protein
MLRSWLAFWKKCSHHFAWYCIDELDLSLEEEAFIPTTNLSESAQSSMWVTQGNGSKVKIDLVQAVMQDMTRSILQQQFCLAFSKDKVQGEGILKKDMELRSAANAEDPACYGKAVAAVVHGTPLHSRKRGLEGNIDRSFNMRRKLDDSSMSPTEGTSHWPDKDVRTVWPSISMQPPRSPRQPSSSYNNPPSRPPTRGPPPLLSCRKPYGVPVSPIPASPLLTPRSFASTILRQMARTPRSVPLPTPPSLSQTTPTNAT